MLSLNFNTLTVVFSHVGLYVTSDPDGPPQDGDLPLSWEHRLIKTRSLRPPGGRTALSAHHMAPNVCHSSNQRQAVEEGGQGSGD